MKILLCLILYVGLTLTNVTIKDVSTTDGCYRNYAGKMMTCHGTLPHFSNERFVQLLHVEELDVIGCDFNNVTKRAFQGMLDLRTIRINCNNALEQLIFAENALEDLKLLRLLSLNYNNIRALPPNFICQAPTLQYVYLFKNSLTSIDNLGLTHRCNSSEIILGCGHAINTLVLRNNFIERLPNYMMCSLRNMTRLDLGQNNISRIDQDAFFHLQSLLDLDLSENNLTLIPEEVGKSLKNVLILNLSYNSLLKNGTSILKHLNQLRKLNMTSTGSAVRDGMKDDVIRFGKNILELVLNENGISEINETLFEPAPEWPKQEEDLIVNCQDSWVISNYGNLVDPTASLVVMMGFDTNYKYFSHVTGLRDLRLDSNEFDKVPPALKVLQKLQILSLRRNRIQALNDDDFHAMRFLHYLYLSFNNIQNISGRVFSNLKCLLVLNLDNNAIESVNSTAFDDNIGLLALFLQNNKISSIEGMFQHNINLKTLDLSSNLLTTVAIDSFPVRLSNLNLSHNKLMLVSSSGHSFPVNLGMSILDLSHNQLTRVDKGMFPIVLNYLFLNDNLISSVGSCAFCALIRMEEIHVNNNLLTTVRYDWFYSKTKYSVVPPIVYLQGNKFVCDCTLISSNLMVLMKIHEFAALRCQPEFFKGQRPNLSLFPQRSPEDFLCRSNRTLNASLPGHCNIYHALAWDLIIGDCNNANLGSVPNAMPPNVHYLYFDGNNITKIDRTTFNRTVNIRKLFLNNSRILEIESNAFQSLVNLQILHLQNNLLRVIGEDTFSGLPKLTELYLFSNHIFHVEQHAFLSLVSLKSLLLNGNQLTDFPVWELAHLDNLTAITLSSNPWSCECDYLQKYREWLQKSVLNVHDVNTLFCNYGDNSTSAVPLIAYNGSYCYSGLNFLDSKYFPLTTCLSALALFVFVASTLIFTYRDEIRVIVYYRYGLRLFTKDGDGQDGDQNKVYDAFVCYSHDDEAFVCEQLTPGLENIDPPFRLCLHSRDFVIGSFITDNVLEAVEKSRRTILILSEHFMRSEWCRFEFKTAHLQTFRDPSHRVILIVMGVIPENLHPEIKVFLKTNTYLMWDDRLFWKRLYYAMPNRKANITQDL